MKTVSVQSILLNAASRAGLDGSAIGNLSSTTQTIMLSNLDIHLRSAWEFYDWPDLVRTELRTVQTGADDDIYLDLEQAGETAMGDKVQRMSCPLYPALNEVPELSAAFAAVIAAIPATQAWLAAQQPQEEAPNE